MLKTLMPPPSDAVDERDFKAALSLFASGVTIISAFDEKGVAHGMTATAFCSLSLRPPLVLVAIGIGTRCHRLVMSANAFGVSILREDQSALSRHFGGKPNPGTVHHFETLAGVPVLAGSMVNLACSLETPCQGGDHSIFTGRVTATEVAAGRRPLIHFEGRYRELTRTDRSR